MIYQEKCRILFCRSLAGQCFLLRFESKSIASFAKPGQMVFVRITEREVPLLRRPFAVFDANPPENFFDIFFNVVGKGTALLSRKKKGEILDVMGPSGNGFLMPGNGETVIAVAGGLGIAPIHFLCRHLAQKSVKTHLFYGAPCAEKLCVRSFPDSLPCVYATDDGSYGEKGFITEALEKKLTSFPEGSAVYACGPEPMMKTAYNLCRKRRWKCQVSLERHMACGVGACNGCVVDAKDGRRIRVCKEGPVFNAGDLKWT